ncbi:MAG: ABC-2 family transporter protein [Deltaproteobacteria bacterium]|nr:ABC-2 family transporter protein [Deltaproteobacteria bacterium]
MLRYLRLFLYFVRFSISRALEFRFDFTFRIVMDCVYYFVNIYFYKILFIHSLQIAGWSEPQMMIFISGYLLIDALNMTLFSNNTWAIPILVNRGDLDYYMLRPVSTFFFISLRDFAANSFINLLITIGIMTWSFAHYPVSLPAINIVLYLVFIINGLFLYHAMNMLFIIPVFWTHSVFGFREVFWGFVRVLERPDQIYDGWIRKLFTFILPFCLMASFPAKLLFESLNSLVIIHIIFVTSMFWGLVMLLWHLALRHYSSASS